MQCVKLPSLDKGRRNKHTQLKVIYRSVSGGGAVNSQSATKIYFFLLKENDAECSVTDKYVF